MNILFFADRWDDLYRRRQQLALQLIKSESVDHLLYIERPMPISSFVKYLCRKAERDVAVRWRKVLKNRSWLTQVNKQLSILTTFAPFPVIGQNLIFNFSEFIRDEFLKKYLGKHFGWNSPVVYVSHPQISKQMIRDLKPGFIWYDCTEDFSVQPGIPPNAIDQMMDTDHWCTEHADVITAVSHTLYEGKRSTNRNTHYLPNAVDAPLFDISSLQTSRPLELKEIMGPVFMFVGGLNEWAHDWKLLDEVAGLRPQWTFVLIGGISISHQTEKMIRKHSNILLLGKKPYSELPIYLAHSDICIQFYLPMRKNDTGNSQKLFLYLAAGKPVISTCSADAAHYKEWVRIIGSTEDFIKAGENILDEKDAGLIEMRRKYAALNSWDQRGKELLKILSRYDMFKWEDKQ